MISNKPDRDISLNQLPGMFYCKLPQPLQLQGHWKVALLQMQYINAYFKGSNPPRNLFVCSDICTESTFGNEKISILKRVSNTNTAADQPIETEILHLSYVPIHKENINIVRIYIKDGEGKPVLFSQGPLLVTLHLKRVSSF